ncbi:DUF86 domain-containing protein [Candidatus Woesearchaeota archaeon]|nr:DUF86 domain-containing protein [Candidatus Woesearchaeota archaeon]
MTYDKLRIGKIVADIERFFLDLDKMGVHNENNLRDEKTFYAVSMLLFSLLNRFIDLAGEIVTAERLGTPGTYKDIFRLLVKHKIISPLIGKHCSNLVYARNLLAHEYQDFTEKDVFQIYKKIKIIQSFADEVKKRVKK